MSADSIISELRQLEIDRQKHLKAIADIDNRRCELLEVTGTRRPVSRKRLSVEDVERIVLSSRRQAKCQ